MKTKPEITPTDYSALLAINLPPVYAPQAHAALRLLSPEQNIELTRLADSLMQTPLAAQVEKRIIQALTRDGLFQLLAENKRLTDIEQKSLTDESERVDRIGRIQTRWQKTKTDDVESTLRFLLDHVQARQLHQWDAVSNSNVRVVEKMSLQSDNIEAYMSQQLDGHCLKASLKENRYCAVKCAAGEFPELQKKFGLESTIAWDDDGLELYLYKSELPCNSALTDTAYVTNGIVFLPLGKQDWVVSPSQFGHLLKGTERIEIPKLPYKLLDQLEQLKSATDATRKRFFKVMAEPT